MALRHTFNEASQCMQHIGQRLTRYRLRKENDEVNRMALVHGHADFEVVFEAADSRTVAGTWINHDDRRLVEIDTVVPAIIADLRDAQQCVVDRALKLACVDQRLIMEVEQRRHARAFVFVFVFVFEHDVGALAQRVPEKERALDEIALVVQQLSWRRCPTFIRGIERRFVERCLRGRVLHWHANLGHDAQASGRLFANLEASHFGVCSARNGLSCRGLHDVLKSVVSG